MNGQLDGQTDGRTDEERADGRTDRPESISVKEMDFVAIGVAGNKKQYRGFHVKRPILLKVFLSS
jgi:hypothetical protein